MSRLRKKTAGLAELFRLYLFVKNLPSLLQSLVSANETSSASEATDAYANIQSSLYIRYIAPLSSHISAFSKYEQLIESLVDFSQLPTFLVNPAHDSDLAELSKEREELSERAQRLYQDISGGLASFAEVKLEVNNTQGFYFRTTKAEDERELRARADRSNGKYQVQVLALLKNGCQFTLPSLVRISDRYVASLKESEERGSALVNQVSCE